jgi:hypothetical protein
MLSTAEEDVQPEVDEDIPDVDIDGILGQIFEAVAAGRTSLKYPGDCSSSKLRSFAKSCGITCKAGGSHYICVDSNGKSLTTIPHSVKQNGTCRSIIKALNSRC